MVERIVALDPGGTTGWAMWTEAEQFTCGQIGPDQHHLELYEFLELQQCGVFTVVCESFEFRQHDNHRDNVVLDSKEYIGIVKLFYRQRMEALGQRLVFQTAGQAKGFIPDKAKNGLAANAKLKSIGLYTPGKVHANDAMRHLITYMVQKCGRTDLVKAWRTL